MIKKLTLKYYVSILISVSFVLAVLILSLNVNMLNTNVRQAEDMLKMIVETQGVGIGPDITGFGKSNVDIVFVIYDKTTEEMEVKSVIDYEGNEEFRSAIIAVNSMTEDSGRYGDHYYYKEIVNGKTNIAMINMMSTIKNKGLLMQKSAVTVVISFVIVAILAIFLTKWSIKPIRKAFKMQKQFISDASHEIKTPLAVILTNAEVLKRENGDSQWLDNIISESKRMNELVNDMISLSLLDEKDKFNKEEFNLSDVVKSVALMFEVVAYENKKNLVYDIKDDLMFDGEQSKIKQLALILIDNAVKKTDENKFTFVSLVNDNGRIVLEVKNQGETIPIEKQQYIFDRFYRVDSARNKSSGGVGLGLSIAKGIVDLHGGKISLISENEETSFKVTL